MQSSTIRCPNCGNALPPGVSGVVVCSFCRKTVPVGGVPPQNPYAPQPQNPYGPMPMRQIRMNYGSQRNPLVFIILATALVPMIIGFIFAFTTVHSTSSSSRKKSGAGKTNGAKKAEDDALLKFGGKGTGAGLFQDGRAIAVDDDDHVFVAEYSGGKISEFDAKGKYVRRIDASKEGGENTYIPSIAVDHAGHLYVVRSGAIAKYATSDGKHIADFTHKGSYDYFRAIAVDPDGIVWGATQDDQLFEFDGEGKELHSWKNLVQSVNKKAHLSSPMLAVDGEGNIFVADETEGTIYVFDKEGHYSNKFTVKDADGSKFVAAIAVDPKGRVFASHFDGITYYDNDGSLGGEAPSPQSGVRDIAFDAKGNMFLMTTNEQMIMKFAPPE